MGKLTGLFTSSRPRGRRYRGAKRPIRTGWKGLPAVSRILVIKLRAIGDVVLATAVLPNLRKAFPGAEIHFLTEKPSMPVLDGNPFVDRTDTVPADPWSRSRNGSSWAEFFQFIRRLRRARYDLVFDLFGNPRSAWLTAWSGARIRVGFDFRGRRFAYNRIAEPRGGRVHEVEFNLDALRRIGIPVVDSKPLFPLGSGEIETAGRWLSKNKIRSGKLAALHVWGSWPAKRWGLDAFARLGDALVRDRGFDVVLLWGPGEKRYAETVRGLMRQPCILAPEMTLKGLGALLARCTLVVANDSGPMHISAAVGTPTVGIFGPTNWRLQGPYGGKNVPVFKMGLECLGCNRLECGDLKCMETLGVEEVLKAVDRVMRRKSVTRGKSTESCVNRRRRSSGPFVRLRGRKNNPGES
jgi:ADP-heptose:LPS heptosyltransferase